MNKTQNDKPLIIWQKWADPFLEKIYGKIDEFTTEQSFDNHSEYLENNDDLEENTDLKIKFPIIMTPMGLLPYNENTACGKLFNFWVGHTNFSITYRIKDIIERCRGVETLDVFTRYRFRIGVGKAFKDSDVMRSLNSMIYEYVND